MGLDPVDGGDQAMIITTQGPVLLTDIEKISDNTANPPPPMPKGGGMGTGGPPGNASGAAANGGSAQTSSKKPKAKAKKPGKQPPAGGAQNGKSSTKQQEGRAAKAADPFSPGAQPHWLTSARNEIECDVAAFLHAEAARTASDVIRRAYKKASDHTDPKHSTASSRPIPSTS